MRSETKTADRTVSVAHALITAKDITDALLSDEAYLLFPPSTFMECSGTALDFSKVADKMLSLF
jgi:hypothetical protein